MDDTQGQETAGIELEIESLAFGGEGVARHEGKVRFVPGALPGETVRAVPLRTRRQYDRMRLLEIVSPSPDRVAPLCSHTALCGGCSIQTLRYERQLESKAEQVRQLLERLGGVRIDEPHAPIGSPLLIGYRNKMEFTFAPRAWTMERPSEEERARSDTRPAPALGLHVPGRYDAVFDLADCVLSPAPFVRAVEVTRAFAQERGLAAYRSQEDDGLLRHLVVRCGANTGEVLIAIVVRVLDDALIDLAERLTQAVPGLVGVVAIVNRTTATVARGDREVLLTGRPFFRERLAGLEFELSAQSFFQTNTRGAEALVEVLARMAPIDGGRLLDLYCGAGTLGLTLASRTREVLGVEQVESAVDDARRTAQRNGVANAEFVRADVEAWVREPAARPDHFDCVVIDPPRAGLHPKALTGLIALGAPRVLYVSCNPSTLARDTATLIAAGYRAAELQVIDLFPHTAHVESIVRFERT